MLRLEILFSITNQQTTFACCAIPCQDDLENGHSSILCSSAWLHGLIYGYIDIQFYSYFPYHHFERHFIIARYMSTNLLLSGHTAEILTVQYNNTSTLLASGGLDRSIFLWSPKDNYENIATMKGHNNAITALCWTHTDRLISASADKVVGNWDAETLKIVRKYKGHSCIIHDVATPKKTLELIASVSDDGLVKIWEQRSKQAVKHFQTKYPLISVCFSMNGDKIFTGGIDNDIKVYNVAQQKIEEKIQGHQDNISCLELSHDGTYLMSNSFDQTIRIWDVRPDTTKRLVKTLCGHVQGNQKSVLKGSWSKDGLYLCCGSTDKCVYIWDTTTKKIVQKLGGHTGTVNQATMTYGNWLASCSNDKNIIVSELPDIFL